MSDADSQYEVRIEPFEGPMDLLLYLVQKNEVDPMSISIAEITDQYLTWLKQIEQADLSQAGEFLVMASRLMALKVRELLPKDQQSEVDLMEFDQDREELIAQMLEYQRFKQVAHTLQKKEDDNVGTYSRGRMERARGEEDTLAEVGVWQLFKAFQRSLIAQNRESIHTIELDDVTIEDRQQHINNYLAGHGRALLEDLLGRDTRPLVLVVTFMALLEMIKTEDVVLRQSEPLGTIWIYRRQNNQEFSDEMARETTYESQDPRLDAALVESVRQREAELDRQAELTLDAVMREVMNRVARGEVVNDRQLEALLAGERQEPDQQEEDSQSDDSPSAELAEEPQESEESQQLSRENDSSEEDSISPESDS